MGPWLLIALSSLISTASSESYTLSATCPVVNNGCDLTITLQAHQEWTLKKETPLSMTFELPEGAKSAKPSLTQSDLQLKNNQQGTLNTHIHFGKTKTSRPIKIAASFYLCTPQICQRFQKNIEIK